MNFLNLFSPSQSVLRSLSPSQSALMADLRIESIDCHYLRSEVFSRHSHLFSLLPLREASTLSLRLATAPSSLLLTRRSQTWRSSWSCSHRSSCRYGFQYHFISFQSDRRSCRVPTGGISTEVASSPSSPPQSDSMSARSLAAALWKMHLASDFHLQVGPASQDLPLL